MQLKGITDGGLGTEPPAVGGFGGLGAIFCNFLEKKAILMPLDHISQVFRV